MTPNKDDNKETRSTWSGFEKLVVYRLDDAKERLGRIESRINTIDKDLRAVEIKSGIWGLLAGLIPAAIIVIVGLLNSGCSLPNASVSSHGSTISRHANNISDSLSASSSLSVLVYIGGLATLGGIVALVISRGSIGIRAVAIGIGCILLNHAVALYANWIFYPILVATGAVSLAYGWRIIREALQRKQETTI